VRALAAVTFELKLAEELPKGHGALTQEDKAGNRFTGTLHVPTGSTYTQVKAVLVEAVLDAKPGAREQEVTERNGTELQSSKEPSAIYTPGVPTFHSTQFHFTLMPVPQQNSRLPQTPRRVL